MGTIIKAPLPYMGGKQKLARKIAALLPPAQLYVEPFCGMGSVFLAREPISRVGQVSRRRNLTSCTCRITLR